MLDLVKRAHRARPEVTAELLRRGCFSAREKAALLRLSHKPAPRERIGPVQFATLLAQGDAQLAARVVLRGLLGPGELQWLERSLRFQKLNAKREELSRVVERALERKRGNARRTH